MDATAQAELVRRKELTPLELVDAAIARIERVNPTLNAVIIPLYEDARAAAVSPDLPEGPFRGVPFLLKDIGAMQKGQPYYMGNRALHDADFRSPVDTPLGARFRAAGLITVGKTNLPEFGMQSTTQPLAFGATRNPWALDRSTSGSSGGSCAAVAAGLVPMAHANDGGGSIRLPAAWCGLVGLKPSRGRISDPLDTLILCELAVSRTVRDVAAVLDAVQGSESGDLFLAPTPARSYKAEIGADPGKLRIGMLTRASFGDIHPECLTATRATAKLLESLGHKLEESYPESVFEELRAPLRPLDGPAFAGLLRNLSLMLGRPATRYDVEPYSWSDEPPPATAEEYAGSIEWLTRWRRRVIQWWSAGFDLLLTPTIWEPPATLESLMAVDGKLSELREKIERHVFFTRPFNLTGQPAISLPLHWTPEGLPVGVQLVGAIGREDLLIRVASQLEQARPWINRRPPVHA
ncbi:MAG: amidase [Deltaproteobacteria bacterium]|nr:amidase [Deltaproteobacteria bacterium]